MTAPARRALLTAAAVVMLLALGPFASPLVAQDVGGVTTETPVDHRNDVPVVQPGRTSIAPAAPNRAPTSRTIHLLGVVVGLLLGAAGVVRHQRVRSAEPGPPPLWSRPPHRGPPLLAAG
jgi:hypothetical protein